MSFSRLLKYLTLERRDQVVIHFAEDKPSVDGGPPILNAVLAMVPQFVELAFVGRVSIKSQGRPPIAERKVDSRVRIPGPARVGAILW